jgi:hypothetical protein
VYCWYLQYWPMRYVAVYTHRCPLKAKVHECIRSVPVFDLYSQCKLSTGSFGVNVCVANLSHLVQPRVAATSFHLKIFIRHRKACCCAGRHVHGRLSVLRLPKLSAKARAHKTPAGQRCRYGREAEAETPFWSGGTRESCSFPHDASCTENVLRERESRTFVIVAGSVDTAREGEGSRG